LIYDEPQRKHIYQKQFKKTKEAENQNKKLSLQIIDMILRFIQLIPTAIKFYEDHLKEI
jgi:hypothetical protein